MTAVELRNTLAALEAAAPVIHAICGEDDYEWADLDQVIDLVRARLADAEPERRAPRYEIIPTPGARLGCSWHR